LPKFAEREVIFKVRAHFLTFILVAIASSALYGCARERLPPLLDGIHDSSGPDGTLCPGPDKVGPFSSELERRLRQQFPGGSPESRLVAALKAQGFLVFTSRDCLNDKAIRSALFTNSSDEASVYWKADSAHRLIWTKAILSSEAI
jgi:hypothetical protein